MKNLKFTLLILTAALLFTACEKEETPEIFDTISGILTPGENLSAEDLNGLKVYLGRFHDNLNNVSLDFNSTAIDSIAITTINADGSFIFENLLQGNYALALEEGYIFSVDTALVVHLNGGQQNPINKSVEACPPENLGFGLAPGEYRKISMLLKKENLSSLYQIKKIRSYLDPEDSTVSDVPSFSDELKLDIYAWHALAFEIWRYDESGILIDSYYSEEMRTNPTESIADSETYQDDYIKITWIPYRRTGALWWKKEYPGYYLFSDK